MNNKKVLATVNGREVLEQDVDMLLRSLDPQRAAQFHSPEGRAQLLEELISQELFYLDAIKTGLDKDQEFISELEKTKEQVLKQFAIHKVLKDVKVNEEETLSYYEKNKNQFVEGESVRASHILIDDEDKAKEAAQEIKAGLSFEEAAQKYSACPSSAQGGDLGFFTRGKMVPQFEEAAFKMEVGEISQPVKSDFGYHIIKLVDKKEEDSKSYDQVKEEIRQRMLLIKQQEVYLGKIDQFKKEYEVKVTE